MSIPMTLHDELHRLVLRARWTRWSLRNYCYGDYQSPNGRHIILSNRLTRWRPTWEQRQAMEGDRRKA